MQTIIRSVPTLMDPEKAQKIAAELSRTDDWEYIVDAGDRWARVEIRDEDGEHVGYL